MLHIQTISTLDLPELQPYRTLRRHDEHRREQIFVAEGELTLRRLLETSFILTSVLLTPEWLTIFRPLLQSRAVGPDAYRFALLRFFRINTLLALGICIQAG